MLRVLLCLILVLFAPAGGGFFPAVSAEVCAESCEDDDAQGHCAPDCSDCTCCTHGRTFAVLAPATSEPRPPGAPRFDHDEAWPASADVGDILHVPIGLLA